MNKRVLAVLVLMTAATQAVAQQPPKRNSFSFWRIMSAMATLGSMAVASCAGLRRRISIQWLAKDCGLRNSWWNLLAPLRVRR